MSQSQLPQPPGHPEPHSMKWSELELAAIKEYGEQCARAALVANEKVPSRATDIATALSLPGCERLKEWAEIGPVQMAAVEEFAYALAAKVPAGFVLVPVKPTPEMLHCAEMWDDGFRGAWSRALAAAPAPEADLLCRLMAHGAVHHTGDDERLTCTQEQAAKAMLDVLGFDVEWAAPATEAAPAQAQQAAELLPCPSCGSHAIAREGYHTTCLSRGAEGTDADEATDNAAAAAWNRRAKAKPEAQQATLPDPHGCLACTHPDCGRFDGPRSVECRAMADGACARGIGASGEASNG